MQPRLLNPRAPLHRRPDSEGAPLHRSPCSPCRTSRGSPPSSSSLVFAARHTAHTPCPTQVANYNEPAGECCWQQAGCCHFFKTLGGCASRSGRSRPRAEGAIDKKGDGRRRRSRRMASQVFFPRLAVDSKRQVTMLPPSFGSESSRRAHEGAI